MYCRAKTGDSRQLKIVISGGLGDHLLATPFIRHFRTSGQYDTITCAFHGAAAEIFDKNPHIDRRIPCSGEDLFLWALPEKDSDVFSPYVDVAAPESIGEGMQLNVTHILTPNQVPKTIISQVAEHHGISLDREDMEIFTTAADECRVSRLIHQHAGKPIVFLNTRSRLPQKDLPPGVTRQIVSQLQRHCELVQRGDSAPAVPGVRTIRPMLTIMEAAALFKRVACVLTVDSFPGHLATAVKTPAVVLFGPSNPTSFGHHGNINIRDKACPPCADTAHRIRCRLATCMEAIDPKEVIDSVLHCIHRTHTAGLHGNKD